MTRQFLNIQATFKQSGDSAFIFGALRDFRGKRIQAGVSGYSREKAGQGDIYI